MAYLSLYRRLRPLAFAQLTGQEHITRTLSHALSRGQLAHAYLFCGPRGTGKTTTAKIMARAVNCHRYPAPEPCGECSSCRNIADGVSLDVIEMDAASNRGIDEIRDLREKSRYASGESRYKVYIIDEAHMLTNEACNAFLKTLEEPPPGVIFILATTDPARLPSTVVSRCQRFDFHLLTVEQIGEKLRQVLADEGWQAEDEAVRLMARLAEGSLRDALGILEQCSAYGEEPLSAEHVRSLTGVTRVETIGALIGALAEGDLEAGLETLQEIIFSGRDLIMLSRDLTFFFSRLLLGGAPGKLRLEESYYGFEALLQQFRGRFARLHLLELIELLHGLAGEMRYAHYPQFILEVAFIRMMRLLHREALSVDSAPVETRIEQTEAVPEEHRVAQTEVRDAPVKSRAEKSPSTEGAAGTKGPPEKSPEKAVSPPAPAPEKRMEEPEAASPAAAEEAAWWEQLCERVRVENKAVYRNLNASREHRLEGNLLILSYESGDYAGERVQQKEQRFLLEESCSKVLSRQVSLRVRYEDYAPESAAAEDVPPAISLPREGEGGGGRKEKAAYSFEDAVKLFPGEVFEV